MNKHQRQAAAFTVVIIGAAMAGGCEKSAAKAKAEQALPTSDKSAAAESQPTEMERSPSELKDTAQGQAVLARYESIRAALAKDDVVSTAAHAAALEKFARSASAASGEVGPNWGDVAEAAKRLHEMPKDDADSVRKAFGDVSQKLVGVLAADKTLAEGIHVFECPMAQGYKKWVQHAAKISNPYMGTRMPECGSESHL